MFEWITGVIGRLGYVGVFTLTFLESLFPPIPSELVIPLAGFVAADGDMHLGGVIAVGTAGSLAGAAFWYAIEASGNVAFALGSADMGSG
jgi:membrane protein DedA with SNARE-associated domain